MSASQQKRNRELAGRIRHREFENKNLRSQLRESEEKLRVAREALALLTNTSDADDCDCREIAINAIRALDNLTATQEENK